MDRRRSRRDLFRIGRAKSSPEPLQLLRVGRPAMGTRFEILFPSVFRELIESTHRALDEVRRLEALMTYFDASSQVSQLNREAFHDAVRVDPELFEILRVGMQLWESTGGAFDLAAGALWRCWGFHQKRVEIPSSEALSEALANSGFQSVALNEVDRTVRFAQPELEVNLGSIGKGFALDRAGAILQNSGLENALLHSGHSSILALGSPASDGAGWSVSVRKPLREETDLLLLRLKDLAMGTSGVEEQYFEIDGKRYGHILDPRSGQPATNNLSATAISAEATSADALATAFFVMSVQEVEDYCRRNPSLGAILVPVPERVREMEVLTFGIAADCIEEMMLD